MCELLVVRMAACDVEVMVMECSGVNDCVMTGGCVEMTVMRFKIQIFRPQSRATRRLPFL